MTGFQCSGIAFRAAVRPSGVQLDRTCADASATGHVGRILVVPSEVAGAGTVFARVGVRRPVDWYLVFSAAWRAHRRLSPARGRANSESRRAKCCGTRRHTMITGALT